MKIEPKFEGIGTDKGKSLVIKRIDTTYDTFNVVGHVSGNFRVAVQIRKRNINQDIVSSNTVDIEVFPKIRLIPNNILIFPGG